MQHIDFDRKQKVHFIGIGGISMSGIAQILLSRGFEVTGSDAKSSELTRQLEEEGARIFIGHSADNISEDTGMVVYTAAVHPDNPEYQRTMQLKIPCFSRAEFLGELMKNYKTAICVSGTHGKTTTTSLLSQILLDENTDPTIMVGGILPAIHGNTRIGHSEKFLTEACEYTNSFLSFFPTIAVILNVREDHMDFFKDLADIRKSFREFARLPGPDGALVIYGGIEDLGYFTEGLQAKVVTFGLTQECTFQAVNVRYTNNAFGEFDVLQEGHLIGHVALRIPGEHNVLNAVAAIAAAVQAGIDGSAACEAAGRFYGVNRRFQYKGSIGGVKVIDDYAHHPDEIEATLKAAQKLPHRKLWVVFQPHTYSRTEAFLPEFAEKLSLADAVVLAEIYPAREKNIHGTSSRQIEELLQAKGVESYYFPTFDEIENFLLENCESGDVFITMGAGDVVIIGDHILGR